ncbi:MAG: hypothetical protein IJZ75_06620 [Clostridia bacterium]|nr:hypothetical protein [Clostridia bacterium]
MFLVTELLLICLAPFFSWVILPAAFLFICFGLSEIWFIPAFIKSYDITAAYGSLTVSRGILLKRTAVFPNPQFMMLRAISLPDAQRAGFVMLAIKSADALAIVPDMPKAEAQRLISMFSVENEI